MTDSLPLPPGKYWVIHFGQPKEVDLIELNGSPYGSYLYSKALQCAFYVKDVFPNRMEAVSHHNRKIVNEIARMEQYISAQKHNLIEYDYDLLSI